MVLNVSGFYTPAPAFSLLTVATFCVLVVYLPLVSPPSLSDTVFLAAWARKPDNQTY